MMVLGLPLARLGIDCRSSFPTVPAEVVPDTFFEVKWPKPSFSLCSELVSTGQVTATAFFGLSLFAAPPVDFLQSKAGWAPPQCLHVTRVPLGPVIFRPTLFDQPWLCNYCLHVPCQGETAFLLLSC